MIRRHVDDQRHHRARRADASRAEREGERIEPIDVEPDHQRAGVIIGAGADRLAEQAEAEEREQSRRKRDRGDSGIGLGGVDQHRAELKTVVGIGRLHRAGVRPENDQQRVDDDDRQRHHQQKLAVLRPGDERIDQARLQRVAEDEHHRRDRHEHDQRIEMKRREQHDRDIHRDRHHLAMGEIDDAHHAENNRQPKRHQAVDQTGQNTGDGDIQINVKRHRRVPAFPRTGPHDRSGYRGMIATAVERVTRGSDTTSSAIPAWRWRPPSARS